MEKENNFNLGINRDLYSELRTIGFTSDQCIEILDWTEKLPIHLSASFISVKIEQGIIKVKQLNEQ